jgi:zinc/manganese transport system permease protein
MFEYDFMRSAFAAATVVSIVAGAVGYFIVLRSQAFTAHALTHVGFAGATAAALIGVAPLWGLLLMTILAGIAIGFLDEDLAHRDIATGIVLAFSLGLGLLFLSLFTASANQVTALLFGNVLAVDPELVWILLALGGVCLTGLAVISRPLLFVSVQRELAAAKGVAPRLYAVLFLSIVAVATAECAQVVGVLLVFALMVGPAAAAQRLTTGVATGVLASVGFALLEAWLGITLAYYTDWPSSFWITTLSATVYLAASLPRWRRQSLTT